MISSSRSSTSSHKPRIVRVRTGCFTCRGRKKKCDEKKPSCSGCIRNRLDCKWPGIANVIPFQAGRNKSHRSIRSQTKSDFAASPASQTSHQSRSLERAASDDATIIESQKAVNDDRTEVTCPPDLSCPMVSSSDLHIVRSPSWQSEASAEDNIMNKVIEEEDPQLSNFMNEPAYAILRSSRLAGFQQLFTHTETEKESHELLGHYISVTANAMANGTNPENPFLVQLIPLAFSSNLILQLLLAQSAAHRAIRGGQTTAVAHRYYSQSVRLFRQNVNAFIFGERNDPIPLVLGALIMCFTEVIISISCPLVGNINVC